jgi:hypothetical protein
MPLAFDFIWVDLRIVAIKDQSQLRVVGILLTD